MSKTKKENGPKAAKKCAVCGEMFTPKTANAAYCSTECYKKAKAAKDAARKAKSKKEKAETLKPQEAVSAPVAKAVPKKAKKHVKKTAPKALQPAKPKTEAKNEVHPYLLEDYAHATTELIMTEISKSARHLFFAIRALYPDAVGMEIREKEFAVVHSKKTDAK